jgi:hypothetical protein
MLLSFLMLLAGCNAGRAFIATTGDYADYRRVRVAETFDARMAATWHYLKSRPEGRYAERLRKFFERAEPIYYAARSRNIEGLEAYLLALPDGPHAREAIELVTALKIARRREQVEERVARASGRRLDTDRKSRKAASEFPVWWARTLLDPQLWAKPLSEAPPQFLVRWRLALPRPECIEDEPEPGWRRCTKEVGLAYRVRGASRRVERSITLDLELVVDGDWRLRRAMVSGDDVFVRAQEAGMDRALDAAARKEAAQRFVSALTKQLFRDALECNGGTDDRGVTTLDCEKLRIVIEPGAQGDDMWVVEPIAAAEAPEAPEAGESPPAPSPDKPLEKPHEKSDPKTPEKAPDKLIPQGP